VHPERAASHFGAPVHAIGPDDRFRDLTHAPRFFRESHRFSVPQLSHFPKRIRMSSH